MIDLKKLDWSEIEKITETLPSGCVFEKFWKDGIESYSFTYTAPNNFDQVHLERISEIADYLGVESRHIYRSKTEEVCEGIIFRFDSRGLGVAFNEEIMGHTKLLYGRIYLGRPDIPFIVFDNLAEVDLFKKKKNWEKLKEGLKIDQEFLADPWKEYRAKKKKFEDKLKKVEEATKKNIEETKERVQELEKAINDLETEFLSELGVKKK